MASLKLPEPKLVSLKDTAGCAHLHSIIFSLAPHLNKAAAVHPSASPVSAAQEQRAIMLPLQLIGISLSRLSNHT